jgi:hypothetical protein
MLDASDRTYVIKSAKLMKFRDTKLQAIRFTQSGSKGKLLISFDQSHGPVIRFHKFKGYNVL